MNETSSDQTNDRPRRAKQRGAASGPEVLEGLTDELIWAIRTALDVDAATEAAALAIDAACRRPGRPPRAARSRSAGGPDRRNPRRSRSRASGPSRRDRPRRGSRDPEPEEVGAAIAQLETDDAIDLLEDLDEPEQIALLEGAADAGSGRGRAGPDLSGRQCRPPDAAPAGGGARILDRRPDHRLSARRRRPAGRLLRHLHRRSEIPPGRLDPAQPHSQKQAQRASERAHHEGAAHRSGGYGSGGGRLSLQPI